MNVSQKTRKLTITAVLAAVAAALMTLEMPLPFMPPFLKVDPSSVPILIGGFVLGPVSAVIMSLIKALIHALTTTTGGVGEIADFLITSSFAVTAALIYKKHHTKKGAILACIGGVTAITITGALANKLILIPFYSTVMPMDVIFDLCNKVNPLIHDLDSYILYGAIPFNMLKGAIISVLTFLVYRKMAGFINTYMAK